MAAWVGGAAGAELWAARGFGADATAGLEGRSFLMSWSTTAASLSGVRSRSKLGLAKRAPPVVPGARARPLPPAGRLRYQRFLGREVCQRGTIAAGAGR